MKSDAVKKLLITTVLRLDYAQTVMQDNVEGGSYLSSQLRGPSAPTQVRNKLTAALGNQITVGDVCAMSPKELCSRVSKFGQKSLRWLEAYLHLFGLHLKDTESIFALSREQLVGIEVSKQLTAQAHEKANATADLLDAPIEILELGGRAVALAKCDSIKTVRELVNLTEAELLRSPNFGPHSLKQLKESLALKGLHLGMNA